MPEEQVDNLDQLEDTENQADNQDLQNESSDDASEFSWKSSLSEDLQGSPSLKKFADDKSGLENVAKSYLELQKMMGHEKIPMPKDDNDVEGKALFNKAMGIPDSPKDYALSDVKIPDQMKPIIVSKDTFAEIVHKQGLTPKQADGMWKEYNRLNLNAYEWALGDYQKKVDETKNTLANEWGDGYNVKISQAQSVINEFGGDKETQKFLTANLIADPRGAKFLADIGHQFAENQIGEFSQINYARTPAEAKAEVDKIMANKGHDYYSDDPVKRGKAIDYVNSLLATTSGK